MKIVLLSDIHANLPAFEAALKNIDAQYPDAIYCLGDLVGYNIWPNEVIWEMRRRHITTIAGNHDAKVQRLTDKQLNEGGKNYAYKIIGNEEKKYLATLPAHLRIEFRLNDYPIRLLLVHGSPYSNEEYLLEDKAEAEFLELFRDVNADILCFGHSHKPYYRVLTGETNSVVHYRHAINAGSVGKPKDGNPQGCYVMLHLNETSTTRVKDSIRVELVRFDYDIEKAAKAIESTPLPDEFADMLRKAF